MVATEALGGPVLEGVPYKKKRKSKYEFLIFMYFWPLVIFPKEIQFILLFGTACLMVISRRKEIANARLSFSVIFIILGCLVHLSSILVQWIQGVSEVERLFAAFNTLLIWFAAIVFYVSCRQNQYCDADFNRVYRCVVIAFVVLGLIYLISSVIDQNVISIGGHKLYFRRFDYLATGTTMRFAGLMETVLGPGHLYCITAPILVVGVKRNAKKIPLSIAVLVGGYFLVAQTHSRIGLIVCSLVCLASIVYILCSSPLYKELFCALAIVLLAISLIYFSINIEKVAELFNGLFSSRSGSNDARFEIYRKSIAITLENSPLIGMGIKHMLGSFPYGSHCTYIGLFYKTGFVGLAFFITGFVALFGRCLSVLRNAGYGMSLWVIVLLYLAFLIFADLDASNWTICLAFATWGLLSNPSFVKKNDKGNEERYISVEG